MQIAAGLRLDPARTGLTVAFPALAGALPRVVNIVPVDRLQPKRAGLVGQVILGLLAFCTVGVHGFGQVLGLGVVLGVAGASVAVALPLVSRWDPPSSLGLRKQRTGRDQAGFVIFARRAVLALATLSTAKPQGRTTWGVPGTAGARI